MRHKRTDRQDTKYASVRNYFTRLSDSKVEIPSLAVMFATDTKRCFAPVQ